MSVVVSKLQLWSVSGAPNSKARPSAHARGGLSVSSLRLLLRQLRVRRQRHLPRLARAIDPVRNLLRHRQQRPARKRAAAAVAAVAAGVGHGGDGALQAHHLLAVDTLGLLADLGQTEIAEVAQP